MKDLENHVLTAVQEQPSPRSSTAAHTPGPWVSEISTSDFWIVAAQQSSHLSDLAYVWATHERPAKANARLMAAAPDMADAIKTAMHECWEPEHQVGVIMPAWVFDKLQAALAKAEVKS